MASELFKYRPINVRSKYFRCSRLYICIIFKFNIRVCNSYAYESGPFEFLCKNRFRHRRLLFRYQVPSGNLLTYLLINIRQSSILRCRWTDYLYKNILRILKLQQQELQLNQTELSKSNKKLWNQRSERAQRFCLIILQPRSRLFPMDFIRKLKPVLWLLDWWFFFNEQLR